MNRVSPLTIELLIACVCSNEPCSRFTPEQWSSCASKEARQWLLDNDLIGRGDHATERGMAWLEFICATPLPEQAWILPARDGAAAQQLSTSE